MISIRIDTRRSPTKRSHRGAGHRRSADCWRRSLELTLVLVMSCLGEACVSAPATIDHDALLRELKKLPEDGDAKAQSRRRIVVHKLIGSGEQGLAATRAAAKQATDPKLKKTLEHLVAWQLGRKISPRLRAGFERNLRYDGQYESLREEGPEINQALFLLLNDEATPFDVRLASCQAMADVMATEFLPDLRSLYRDPLLSALLHERVGVLMAILGDPYAVEQELKTLEPIVAGFEPNDPRYLTSNERLAELYYEIRDYAKAIACYDRVLGLYEDFYKNASKRGLRPAVQKELVLQLALHYYNAACNCSLNNELEKARTLLKQCIRYNPKHFSDIEEDGDFTNLRDSEGYDAFRKELGKLLPKESL